MASKVETIANLRGSNLETSNPAVVPQHVVITKSDGTITETFGGGTQYTQGDTDATITGTAVMFESNTGTNAIEAVSPDAPLPTTPTPSIGNGLSIFRSLDLDESEEEVKGTAGQVYGVWFTNTSTGTRWLKFYNATAASVTVGTTTPVITLALPGNSADDISGVFSSTHGLKFDTAITVAVTTGVADADTGAPSANDVIVNIFYK
jgi:hypothetical protein